VRRADRSGVDARDYCAVIGRTGVPGRMPYQIAVAFALCAFVLSLATGLLSSVEPMTILLRSIVVLVVGGAMGRVFGLVAQVTMNEHLTAMTNRHPIPEPVRVPDAPDAGVVVEEQRLEDVDSP
jgi:hypothetical protein